MEGKTGTSCRLLSVRSLVWSHNGSSKHRRVSQSRSCRLAVGNRSLAPTTPCWKQRR